MARLSQSLSDEESTRKPILDRLRPVPMQRSQYQRPDALQLAQYVGQVPLGSSAWEGRLTRPAGMPGVRFRG